MTWCALLMVTMNVQAQQALDEQAVTLEAPTSVPEFDKNELSEEELNRKLFDAIAGGDLVTAKLLLNAMTYYAQNQEGETALTLAIKTENVDMVALLVQNAVINLKNADGETPLTLAIRQKNAEIMDLVAKRAKAALKNDAGVAPLFLALEHGAELPFLQRLVNKGADVNRPSNGITPLYLAAQQENVKGVAFLLRNGAKVSNPNENGESPMYIAVANGYDLVTGILAHKSEAPAADVNWQNELGEPLLNIAAEMGHTEIVRILLEKGADPNVRDYMDNTALILAADRGDEPMVKMLLAKGADVNHQNIMGYTAITLAAKNQHGVIANMLAENGANPEIRSFQGFYAAQFGDYANAYDQYNQQLDAELQAAGVESSYEQLSSEEELNY